MRIDIYQLGNGNWVFDVKSKAEIIIHKEKFETKFEARKKVNDIMSELKMFLATNWSERVNIEGQERYAH